jgi:DnaK suppressor protein
MEPLTQSNLNSLRDMLARRLQELQTEIHAADAAMRANPQPTAGEVNDQKDMASRHQELEVADAQEQRDRNELVLVESALRRLEQGVYGDCVDCGEPIPPSRLQVQPAALRCAACQSLFERGGAQARSAPRQ